MPRIVTVVGSASEDSKTRRLAVQVQDAIVERTDATPRLVEINDLLADLAIRRREDASPALESALRAIETADLLIAASPVYKGSYTGLFKHLYDLLDYKALSGVPVGLLALGGSDRHALVVEHQFRPLFAFFGAATLPTAVFVNEKSLRSEGGVDDATTAERITSLINEAVTALEFRRERKGRAA